MTTLLDLPTELQPGAEDEATGLLQRYFDLSLDGGYYSGALFERLDGGGDREEVRDKFTGADLIAVKMLSIRVPQEMVYGIRDHEQSFSDLLRQIPHDLDLVDASVDVISKGSPAWTLWSALNRVHGVGWVVANKLLARKRPRLLPVYDNDVRDLLGSPNGFWSSLHATLRADDGALHNRLVDIRHRAGVGGDISPLRVFDIVCWMAAQRGGSGTKP